MTEVRISSVGGKGLFATKAYKKGSLLLEEEPIFAPLSDEESKKLLDENNLSAGERSKLWDTSAEFRGMVMTGLCWIEREKTLKDSEKKMLLDLYHPTKESASDLERPTIEMMTEAVDHLKDRCGEETVIDWMTLEKVLLIWACNSFQGGRVYSQISRINHDCNPNVVVQAEGDTQRILAATDIPEGDEITISYLGLLLYAEVSVRRGKLLATKFFHCQCARCSNKDDVAGRIPCPVCHPRELPQQSLEEDVQYDDEHSVQYVSIDGPKCTRCKLGLAQEQKLQAVMKNVTWKIVSYMDSINSGFKVEGGDDDDEEATVLEEHLGLATTIMGDRHWTTNLLKLMYLDQRLSHMSQVMLTTQELPEMEEVAEAIDSLQRVERFVQSLDLKLESGHILGDVVIGIARTLVSLGDLKSQKYAAQWLDKVADYVENFESEGRQKVVDTLKVAWKKHKAAGEEGHPATKKIKS
jgi:SET domain